VPVIIGYATKKEIKALRKTFEVFLLDSKQNKGLGIKPIRKKDKLVMSYIPMSRYVNMNPEKWDNTYIIDERNKDDQLNLGI
jgi:hypothetical protein